MVQQLRFRCSLQLCVQVENLLAGPSGPDGASLPEFLLWRHRVFSESSLKPKVRNRAGDVGYIMTYPNMYYEQI